MRGEPQDIRRLAGSGVLGRSELLLLRSGLGGGLGLLLLLGLLDLVEAEAEGSLAGDGEGDAGVVHDGLGSGGGSGLGSRLGGGSTDAHLLGGELLLELSGLLTLHSDLVVVVEELNDLGDLVAN